MQKRLLLALVLLPLSLSIVAATRSRGVRKPIAPVVPTFNKEVVRIFQQHCQSCHRDGDIAPFPLTSYDPAYAYRHLIRLNVQNGTMPPWKPADGCGDFQDVRKLTQDEIDTITRWVDAGAPQGLPQDLPAPVDFGSGWSKGEPDLTLTMPEPYSAPEGEMYRCFPIKATNSKDEWVSAMDIRPGNRAIVHHVIAFLDASPSAVSEQLDAAEPGPGYTCFGGPGFTPEKLGDPVTLGGWAPGSRPFTLPDGVGMRLPKDVRVVLQVHYHSHGHHHKIRPHHTGDQTSIGIYYAKAPVAKELRIIPIANMNFTIPAGDPNYLVQATFPNIFGNAHALMVFPHMHLLGKRIKVQAHYTNGQSACLIDIPNWDFNWQGAYMFKEPVPIPMFTQMHLQAWYDNSANNPRNPNSPPKPVSWGEATTDEMALAFLGVTLDSENLLPKD